MMNELSEDEKLLCRKKCLSSFERCDDKSCFPLHKSHSESLSPSGQSKIELNKKKKVKTRNLTSENEDGNMAAVNNNPRIPHSTKGDKKLKDKTGKKRHKEKLRLSRPCNNEIRARQNDELGESCPNSQEKRDVHSNSFQSRDTSAIKHRPTTSGSVKKKKKIKKPDIEGHNSKCDSRRAPVEQARKKDTKSPAQCAQFDCIEKVSPLKLQKIMSIGSQEKGCEIAGNKLSKNGAKTEICRDSCQGIIEKAGLLNLNGNSSNKKIYKLVTSSKKKKDNHDNDANEYSKNNSCTKRLKLDKSNANNSKDTIGSNISTINNIAKPTKIRKASKNREKDGVKKKKNGVDRKGKKKAKSSSIRKKAKKMSKSDLLSTCATKNRGLLSEVEPALSLAVGNKSTETQGTLKTSGCLKDSTVLEGQPGVLRMNNNQEGIGLDKNNACPKLEKSDVDWESESIEEIIAKARSLIMKCRRNSLLFKYSACKSEPPENIKSRPLKKSILMRASMRDNLDAAEEKLALASNSSNVNTPLKPEESSGDRFKINSNACLSNSTAPQQGKQNCALDQMYSTINDDDMDMSCERTNSAPSATLVETPSVLSLAPVEDRSHVRHPKKSLLDKFRRDTNESIRSKKVSNEDQIIYHPVIVKQEQISKAEQVKLSAGKISEEKVGLATEETGNENIPPRTATSIHEPMSTANSDEDAWERRPETLRDSRTFPFPGQEKPMKNMYPCRHQCINAGYPFAFSVDCFYNSNCHRVGYIHRRFPAISVPCIIIGEVQFVTIRAALKLFSGFNEKCFIQHFLRSAKSKWICSEHQVSCLKKLSKLPELDLMEGDVLVQVSPLLHNFHCFQHAKRRLLHENHATVNAAHCHEHQCSTPKQ